MVDFLVDDPLKKPRATLLLAHGAGAPMDSEFMQHLAAALVQQRVRVLRFEFAYMAARRSGASRRPPPALPLLLAEYRKAWQEAGSDCLIGGKSLGGRLASLLAAEQPCAGVVCFGYPFHPPGKPQQLRTEHLTRVQGPMLICQGERDPLGSQEQVAHYDFPASIDLHWLTGGDHDFKALKRHGIDWSEQFSSAAQAVTGWLRN